MSKKIVCGIAFLIIAVCLISGGCSLAQEKIGVKSISDLLKLPSQKEVVDSAEVIEPVKTSEPVNGVEIKLYFADLSGSKLVEEDRKIEKTLGIARKSIQELLSGPAQNDKLAVFPEGSKLRDIKLDADSGTCTVDLSSEVKNTSDAEQEKLMIKSIVSTLCQFPAVNNVEIMIEGEKVSRINFVNLNQPMSPEQEFNSEPKSS